MIMSSNNELYYVQYNVDNFFILHYSKLTKIAIKKSTPSSDYLLNWLINKNYQ